MIRSVRTNNSIVYLYSRGVVDSGRYRIDAQLIDVAGQTIQLAEEITVSGSIPEANLFTDAAMTTSGLTGSYVDASLRTVDEPDWRATQTISGTRVDPQISFITDTFGARAPLGITGGADDFNWDNFLGPMGWLCCDSRKRNPASDSKRRQQSVLGRHRWQWELRIERTV